MKKRYATFFLLFVFIGVVYAQRIPAIGVLSFEASGRGVTVVEADELTNKVIAELSSWGTLNVARGSSSVEYFIQGTVTRVGGNLILSASTVNASSNAVLNEYRQQAASMGEFPVFSLCSSAVEKIPFPNYLLGTWQSTIDMPDGPVVCIMEFKSERNVVVERYDTWEHKQRNALRYEGYGAGAYSYVGFANRSVNLSGQMTRVDAAVNVNLKLEETLPDQAEVSRTGLYLVFNSEKTSFQIVNSVLPCGRNFDGPSVYPSEILGFSRFTKIR